MPKLSRYGLLYLATPYTLHADGKEQAYLEASALLGRLQIEAGLPVYSPITHWHETGKHELRHVRDDEWLAINRPIMNLCGAMLVPDINGWDASSGIKEEIVEFKENRKPIYLIDRVLLGVLRRL